MHHLLPGEGVKQEQELVEKLLTANYLICIGSYHLYLVSKKNNILNRKVTHYAEKFITK
jgi:hypothetical protein